MPRPKFVPLLLIAILLGLSIHAAASYYNGIRIEREFEAMAGQLAAEGAEVQITRYQRGLYGAQAQTHWLLPMEGDTLEFVVEHHLQHGPTRTGKLAVIESIVLLPEDLLAELGLSELGSSASNTAPHTPTAAPPPPLRILSTLSFTGGQRHTAHSPAFSLEVDDLRLQWSGLEAQLETTAGAREIDFELLAPGLKLQMTDGTGLDLQRLQMKAQQQQAADFRLHLGEFELRLDAIEAFGPHDSFSLRSLYARAELGLEDDAADLAKLAIALSAAEFKAPELAAQDLRLDLQLRRLETGLLASLAAIDHRANSAGDSGQAAMWFALSSQLPAALARQPELELRQLALTTANGRLESALRLRYQGSGQFFSFDPLRDLDGELRIQSSRNLLEQLLLESALQEHQSTTRPPAHSRGPAPQTSAPTLEQMQQRIARLEREGLLRGDQELVLDLQLSQGALRLHGEAISPFRLLVLGELFR